MIGGLVLAAGAGRRFGGGKLIAPLGGRPLLEHALAAMRAAPVDRTVVVLGAEAERVEAAVDLGGLEVVRCEGWAEGQAASLRAGIGALRDARAAVVILGDQPLISALAIERVLADRGRAGEEATRASYGGVPGHPIVLERTLFAAALALRGDTGARGVLAGARVREVPCDGLGSPDDVDTIDQLEAITP